MLDELEWKTRRDRINTKLKALNPAWNIVTYRPDLETSTLDPHAIEEFPTANGSADVLPLIRHYADRKQEHFICISINGANEVITSRVVSVGLVNKTQVHPREVFADPITDRASSIIVAHNHPSGGLIPNKEELEITQQLKSAGEVLGIKVLDHIIFNDRGYYSLLEKEEI